MSFFVSLSTKDVFILLIRKRHGSYAKSSSAAEDLGFFVGYSIVTMGQPNLAVTHAS
jgi:hypothetical protein